MVRYALIVQYDGASFHGWQIQQGYGTVQGELESVLRTIMCERRPVVGSGRTDRGVHARGQVASVTVPASWSAPRLRKSLNALLPAEIRVAEVRRVTDEFHPRYDAVARSYEYLLGTAADAASPFLSRWCWDTSPSPPAFDLLEAAAAMIPGERDFSRFAKVGQPQRGTRCRVVAAEWAPWENSGLRFTITADRFLHHMVRYLVGTMVAVARGERPLEDLGEMLRSPDTALVTSPPAPPQGLFLTRVDYPPERWGEHPDRDPPPGKAEPS